MGGFSSFPCQLHVETNAVIKKSLECRDLLDEAKNFHLFPDDFYASKTSRFQPRKSTVGVLFAIGGRGAIGEPFCSVECFDFRINQWYEGPELRWVDSNLTQLRTRVGATL